MLSCSVIRKISEPTALSMALIAAFIVSGSFVAHAAKPEVRVMFQTGPELDAFRKVAPEFTKETGINVVFLEVGRAVYQDRLQTQLMGKSSAFDLMMVRGSDVPVLAAAGFLEPLDAYLRKGVVRPQDAALEDFLEGDLERVTYNGHLVALPTDASTFFLFYRKDLIPEPPDTWEEVLETAKRFTKGYNPNSPTVYGFGTVGKAGDNVLFSAAQFMWPYGGGFLDEKGNVILDSEGSRRGLQFFVNLSLRHRVMPEAVATWEYMEVLSALQEGVIAMGLQWNAAADTLLDPQASPKVADRIGIALVPGVLQPDGSVRRVPFAWDMTIAINRFSENKEAAAKLAFWLTGQKGGLLYTLAGGITPRRSVLSHPQVLAQRKWAPLFLKSLETAKSFPLLKEWGEVRAYVSTEFSKALAGTSTVEEALRTAAREFERILSGSR